LTIEIQKGAKKAYSDVSLKRDPENDHFVISDIMPNAECGKINQSNQ